VSFALPSLKVESVGLDLFGELSYLRRSGLTFALETPGCEGQLAINKVVTVDKTISILEEARRRGWRNAKFYFMIGLPVGDGQGEEHAIIEALDHVHRKTGMYIHVNVATFIPKPHTPYQWASQLDESTALGRIMTIRKTLPRRGFKVGYHSPFTSLLEGLVARGDQRVGALLESAFRRGARLDAWEERLQWQTWREVIEDADWNVLGEATRARRFDEVLPWRDISIGVSRGFLRSEWERSWTGQTTPPCRADCTNPCGVCRKDVAVKDQVEAVEIPPSTDAEGDEWRRFLLCLTKTGPAQYLSHLDLLTVVERSLRRAGLRLRLSQGHNPKPRVEFASPLALGITSRCEIVGADIHGTPHPDELRERLKASLPSGIEALSVEAVAGGGRRSLAARYWGSDFVVRGKPETLSRLVESLPQEQSIVSVRPSDGQLGVRHRHIATKGSGILAVLERVLGEKPLRRLVQVERVRTLARDDDETPIPYLS
jgi:hypothetical protein